MANAELISIGSELLLGQILNTNSQYLSTELAQIGINCFFHSTVGDNEKRILECLKIALDRADILLITGGLGPTVDDLTTECLAKFFGVQLIEDKETLAKIQLFFQERGVVMPASNAKQALRPKGADILPNPRGTAPGIIWKLDPALLQQAQIKEPERKRVIMTFPGVPTEMHGMWQETARAYLVKEFGEGALFSCELKHYGIGESALAEKFAHLLNLENPTVAPLAGTGECRLRVTAKAGDLDQARKLAEPVIKEIQETSGTLCYGTDGDTLESVTGRLLSEKGKVIAVAESCTGGLLSKRLTDIQGSSRYIKLNLVTYANQAKQEVLGVDADVLEKHGAVSAECAAQMAECVRRLAGADIGVATTGIAGPDGGSEAKPVGLVYIGIDDGRGARVSKMNYPPRLSRNQIRQRTVSDALNMVRLALL